MIFFHQKCSYVDLNGVKHTHLTYELRKGVQVSFDDISETTLLPPPELQKIEEELIQKRVNKEIRNLVFKTRITSEYTIQSGWTYDGYFSPFITKRKKPYKTRATQERQRLLQVEKIEKDKYNFPEWVTFSLINPTTFTERELKLLKEHAIGDNLYRSSAILFQGTVDKQS